MFVLSCYVLSVHLISPSYVMLCCLVFSTRVASCRVYALSWCCLESCLSLHLASRKAATLTPYPCRCLTLTVALPLSLPHPYPYPHHYPYPCSYLTLTLALTLPLPHTLTLTLALTLTLTLTLNLAITLTLRCTRRNVSTQDKQLYP
jgi:hypothetical protein